MNALNLHPKVVASLLGGWLSTLIIYSLQQWAHVDPPAVVGAAIIGLVTFACGWLAPSPDTASTTDAPKA
jgi:hypothetical protein